VRPRHDAPPVRKHGNAHDLRRRHVTTKVQWRCPALGDPSKAVELLGRALAIKESAFGKDHVTTAYTLMELGDACCDLGDTAKARDSLQRAIPIFEHAKNGNAKYCRHKLASLA